MISYIYEKLCNSQKLDIEIRESEITIALSHITTKSEPAETEIFFKSEISTQEKTLLDNIVDIHDPTPLPDDATKVSVIEKDPETMGLAVSLKFAPDGWKQQLFETELCTSLLNSIHEKNWKNQNIGFSEMKFYNASEEEITEQSVINAECVRTDYLWMPNTDYAIKSGFVTQREVPSENIYVWALGGDIPEIYGGPVAVFAEGGLNMAFVDARFPTGLNGVSASVLNYNHPILGPGAGTNRLRFVFRHPAGFKHKIQIVLEIFRPI
jgi:hypothetical protein